MKLEEKLGIKKELLIQIQKTFSKFKNVDRAVVFGSRARGDYKYNSDIDIAILGEDITSKDFNSICDRLNQLNTAFTFDVLNMKSISQKGLKDNIEREGIAIYDAEKS
ncbi:MAG: nucleotidyltransferase domain-containing protein [Clostridium tyrobutyricum]|uniref:nucleotidyltransferase family protein n=1 Tax=Clostridium tyrobutyricum TaxID=1519 RepID=UPI00073D9B3C|nr:nucleotidyltransferase domain-containing protein [Clostridium tyrobutyricum]MBV4437242.1 nucleotidyltransferase domain-containing protein [Clostridium tyrobutyricum]MCH4199413.1 nucleotidyltransferase domain-containing protein [Clostridium tyrobutyricum]MCH4237829.1 nucleotidyltransferase domain-containing protein [Clostridium tyrobutyricum]MCH4259845.1 nucleotidyltransferase domain-containing protein [Clostridium tyrobutyricum]MCI1240267.1 nucleotidyltransferase domain-containing protein [